LPFAALVIVSANVVVIARQVIWNELAPNSWVTRVVGANIVVFTQNGIAKTNLAVASIVNRACRLVVTGFGSGRSIDTPVSGVARIYGTQVVVVTVPINTSHTQAIYTTLIYSAQVAILTAPMMNCVEASAFRVT